ncbi:MULTISPECIES: M16 family metallopeptidase [Brevibacillus]|uniref:Putative zinc protease YmxG n=1 Tax=Brevibacillus parabrevis TaxID=54914 RepID=A0A4Y3PBP8_BREPA|nr:MULTISPECIES: pitrilysin family protein [Brevibacillus]MDH6350013.1 putative Zn-dependent peptidase [Brevibacillus sp. 1238]MDR4999465.1 pitrilysin family protein [Brevibacillus parabrevis]MED2253974.1 pitrilysin family protein [Brevibacillus parabrevis]RNB94339.1 insulinase family protein [Brevibacillus parabrevis]UED66941.1 insulinase family protein [Brevibacillus sp. HD3.3A]
MIQRHTCENGLRIVTEKIPSVRSVALGIWVGTGSKYEQEKNNGISHFLEHMFFKGTSTRSAKEIAETFDEIGGNVNAFTSKEYTCYYARVLDQHAPIALDVLSDMYFHSVFDAEELEKEKNVVIEEISMYEDTPDDLVHDLIARATYSKHPLGYSILGTEDVLRSLKRDDLLSYIDAHYLPSNTVVTVAGNFDDNLIEEIKKRFSGFSRQGKLAPLSEPEFAANVIAHNKATEQAHLCLSLPGFKVGHPDVYSLILLNNVLGGSMSSRLFQEIREERGLAYSVYSYHSSYKEAGTFTVYTGTAPEHVGQVFDIVTNVLRDVADRGISDKELNKGKEQLKGSLMLSLESTNSRMSRLGKNELLLERHLNLDEIIAKIDRVSHESVLAVAQELFRSKLAMAMVSPLEGYPANVKNDILL